METKVFPADMNMHRRAANTKLKVQGCGVALAFLRSTLKHRVIQGYVGQEVLNEWRSIQGPTVGQILHQNRV